MTNITLKSDGYIPKKRMLLDFIRDIQGWLRASYRRFLKEFHYSADKRVFTHRF